MKGESHDRISKDSTLRTLRTKPDSQDVTTVSLTKIIFPILVVKDKGTTTTIRGGETSTQKDTSIQVPKARQVRRGTQISRRIISGNRMDNPGITPTPVMPNFLKIILVVAPAITVGKLIMICENVDIVTEFNAEDVRDMAIKSNCVAVIYSN